MIDQKNIKKLYLDKVKKLLKFNIYLIPTFLRYASLKCKIEKKHKTPSLKF